ncbi:MAG: 4Fe-4S binding protein [Prevotella sp.]|nr:4Fe-4S binding protein [Prevotella sp.]
MKRFHYHYETKGYPLYWLLLGYFVLGWVWPIFGWALLIFIIGTVATAFRRGRWWCGHICPRGNLFLRLLSRYSPHRPIPRFLRTPQFRLFVLILIFASFGVQIYQVWGDLGAMGRVFWKVLLITTVIGVILSFVYAPMTWCSFCPIGTLAAWAAPKNAPLPSAFTNIHVAEECDEKCKTCARVCPLQLKPYESRGQADGYLHPDCYKCGKCVACPHKNIEMRKH